MCWKYSTWWRPLIWVFKDFLSQTQPTGISSFTPDQVNIGRGFQNPLSCSANSDKNTQGQFSRLILGGGKISPNHAKQILRLRHNDTFCKTKWAKSANSVHSRVRNNLQKAIQGCHCQLDDRCRGPSIKEKVRLFG